MKRTIVNQFWNIIFINDAVILIATHVEQWQCIICSICFFRLKLSICKPRSEDNVMSVWLVTGWMVQGLSSSRVERFSVIQFHPNWFWEPLNLLFIRCWGSYLEVKLPVDEAGHSPPPSAKFKNEWSYDTTPPVCLHGVERDNLLFLTFTYEFASQTVWMFLLLQLFYFITCIFSWIISLLVLNFIQCFINI